MSEPDNFVARWSRLKRSSESRRNQTEPRTNTVPPSAAPTDRAGEERPATTHVAATLDLASLPSIDSITAATDIRVFLQAGVPAQLTRAALRRAWVSDPVVRDFIGIAENQWDFTDPTAIPGFGPLQKASDNHDLVARAAETLDQSLNQLSAPLPADAAFAERPIAPREDSRRDPIEATAREGQATLAMRGVDRETVNSAAAENQPEGAAKRNSSRDSVSPRRRRHTHGGALPR